MDAVGWNQSQRLTLATKQDLLSATYRKTGRKTVSKELLLKPVFDLGLAQAQSVLMLWQGALAAWY